MLAKVLGRYDVAEVRSHKQTLLGSSGFVSKELVDLHEFYLDGIQLYLIAVLDDIG